MCGIAGIISPQVEKYKTNVENMVRSLYHRGPDGNGIKSYDNAIFGHTRLSIIDLKTGDQPMISPVSRSMIVLNGEIYGYREIKKQFRDYPFRTESDTEVILAMYDKYGIELLAHLPGMFSFAIWDDNKKELFCARDRFGEKPFYYAIGKNNELIFASEIKAIIATGLIDPELDFDSVKHYFQYLYVHPYHTIYKNVHVLPPAHYLHYSNDEIVVNNYWTQPKTNCEISMKTATDNFIELFENSVRKQLIADVEVGVFLSGGLDSSTVVAVASRFNPTIRSFSFGFGKEINELPFAQEISDKYNTNHIESNDSDFDIAQLFLLMQDIYDEPFADSSNIPTFIISKIASQYNKVVLGGDGADELLAGYSFWYRTLYNFTKHQNSYRAIKTILNLGRYYSRILFNDTYEYKKNIKNELISSPYKNVSDFHYYQKQYFREYEFDDLLCRKNLINSKRNNLSNSNNSIDDVLRMDIKEYLPGDILVKTDRASMANSLELRSPFLDIDLASFCISLPYIMKIDSKTDKILLRKAYQDTWTDSIKLRKKQGFGAPIAKWLRQNSFQTLIKEYLYNPQAKIYRIIDFEKTQKYIGLNNYQTWVLLVFSTWLDKHSINN